VGLKMDIISLGALCVLYFFGVPLVVAMGNRVRFALYINCAQSTSAMT
jgi:hypothetical protein